MSDDAKSPPAPTAPVGPTPEPFQRKQVTWGRMPATTFHVGPVPIAPNPLDRIPNRPPRQTPLGQTPLGQTPASQVQTGQAQQPRLAPRPNAGILSGSLIPQARPGSTPPPTPSAVPPKPAGQTVPDIDLTVRPLPGAAPEPAPTPIQPPPPVSAVAPVVQTSEAAAQPVSPSLPRTSTRRGSRLPAYIGLGAAAALVIGGGLWFALRSAPEPAATLDAAPVGTTAPVVPAATTPVTPPPVAKTPQPAPTIEATPVEAVPARTTTPAAAPRPTASSPSQTSAPNRAQTPSATPPAPTVATPSQPAPTAVQPAPQIVVVPAPTAARQTQTDPDAPVVTRPQPLD